MVDGQVARLGAKANPETAAIQVDGRRVAVRDPIAPIYLLLNKPIGYTCTAHDAHAERTVYDLLKNVNERIFTVGRLDEDTAGLLLLTNDGNFAYRLAHPRFHLPKTYQAVVRGIISPWALTDLRCGILLEDGMTAPADAQLIETDRKRNVSVIQLTLYEGRNRQVRRMLNAVGFKALALTRMRFGNLTLTGLAPGTYRKLQSGEVKELMMLAAQHEANAEIPPQAEMPCDEANE